MRKVLQRRQILKFGLGAVGGATVGTGLAAPLLARAFPILQDDVVAPPAALLEPAPLVAPAPYTPAAPMIQTSAMQTAAAGEVRRLALHNLHTDEKLDAVYWEDGAYVPDALQAVNKVLRDHRSGEVHAMDRGLLDLLDSLAAKVETKNPFQVISGYRSPTTNAKLAAASKGKQVADHSLHIQGQAIDICVEGCGLQYLQKAALSMARGGVGYYPVSNFVHVDVGRVRSWKGS
jgi:uncharacterized protein YcbK (DUF882 family)